MNKIFLFDKYECNMLLTEPLTPTSDSFESKNGWLTVSKKALDDI